MKTIIPNWSDVSFEVVVARGSLRRPSVLYDAGINRCPKDPPFWKPNPDPQFVITPWGLRIVRK